MSATEKVNELLRESGAELVRDHKHEVWLLPNGNKFTRAKTSSDRNAANKDLSDLRRALGIENQGKGEGERREKRPRRYPQAQVTSGPLRLTRTPGLTGGLAQQLAASGFVEMAESAKARAWGGRWKLLARYYRLLALKGAARIVELERDSTRLHLELSKPCACWCCQLRTKAVQFFGGVR